VSRQGAWKDERGFTLIEVMITILLMGIVFTSAVNTWFVAIEGRRVDDGTNRLAADLRHAHSRAINRLAPQTVDLTAGSSKYTIGPTASSCSVNPANPGCIETDLDDCDDEDVANGDCNVEDVVVVDTSAVITFNSDGSATLPGGAATTTLTRSITADGDPVHNITINAATSRVQVVPYVP
jgi:prepilin-type N-terminal cleavage/methylation domain-containing protein